MIRFYDKTDKKYFEFSYIDIEKLKLNTNIVFITDENIINQIEKIELFLRRFIKFENNTVSIDYTELKADLLTQLKVYRDAVFNYLDSQFFQLTEKIALEDNTEVVATLREELRTVVGLKEQWRNLELHEQFNNLSSIKSYSDIINAIRKDIDPLYVESSIDIQIPINNL